VSLHPRASLAESSRWRACALATLLGLGGCSFTVDGILLGDGGGIIDGDAATNGDAALGSFVPSHVAPSHIQPGASPLSGLKDIDTEHLLLDGKPPPAGVVFIPEASHDAWAVLSVADFTVNTDVLVHGRRSLIVVSVGSIKLGAVMHAEASSRSPGPGGQYTGIGHGGDGKTTSNQDSGGGGGGFGTPGGNGGPSEASTNYEGGPGGKPYMLDLGGGSGGGMGSGTNGAIPCPMNQGWSQGGAGGGVIQLSAKLGIDINETGGINAGGGGGRGGCSAASAGGGGGSGGTIWLEAPSIRIVGKVAANGGGGGSGGSNQIVTQESGIDGQDAELSANPAAGGPVVGDNSGRGGSGAALSGDADDGGKSLNGGGGGGGMGRIRLRTRGASPITAPETLISPPPDKSVDF
jgi:hypothetical protein